MNSRQRLEKTTVITHLTNTGGHSGVTAGVGEMPNNS